MKRVYYNGNIITMTDISGIDYVIAENGVIAGTGKGLPPGADEYVNLEGRTLIPSFIDAHSHFMSVAYSFLRVNLESAVSVKEIREKIRDFIISNNRQGQWVVAMGYDSNALREKRNITAGELDSIEGGCAIVLENKSGHSGIFNGEAQRRLSIENSKDGLLEEGEYLEKLSLVPLEGGKELVDACRKAEEKYLSYGITTAQEGYAMGLLIDAYRAFLDAGGPKLDIVAYPDIDSYEKWHAEFPESLDKYYKNLRIGGIKIMLDGSPQGKTAWISGKYSDGTSGYPAMDNKSVEAAVKWAAEKNIQIIAHCNGDMACEQFINAVDKYKNRRAVIIHAQLLRTDQLKRVRKLGMIASFFPAHIFYWGDVHIKNLGLDRAENISPAGSALKNGVMFTFHQDAPVLEPDMFKTLWCAVERTTKNGVLLGKDERIGVYDALKAVTSNAAFQYFEEGKKGIIAPGAFEDLVIVESDPFKDTSGIEDTVILKTIKRGKTVFSNI